MIRHALFLAAVLSIGLADAAFAADITATKGNGFDLIAIDGPITNGDAEQFDRVSQNVGQLFNQPAIVVLNSPGGSMYPALSIGESIRAKGFATRVVNGSQCASACALIWLAGTKRFLGNGAKLGFHAAYVIADDNAHESGQANALVGAYLAKLGLSYRAIAYVTASAPDQMSWLHPADAQQVGIQLDVLPDPAPAAPTRQAAEAAPVAPQIALLNRQVDTLKSQLTAIAQALDLAQQAGHDKDVQIANLGQQLNEALAAKVQELQSYRSEFFSELSQLLANEPGTGMVADRFVIQSDVLFPVGSADLSPDGVQQISKLADTIKQMISQQIPAKIPWVLDVDGYADKQPINGGQFVTNWELSAARAISVVKLLIAEGVPPDHVAATAYSDNHPLDLGDTPDAYAKNRRIELRLIDRHQ